MLLTELIEEKTRRINTRDKKSRGDFFSRIRKAPSKRKRSERA